MKLGHFLKMILCLSLCMTAISYSRVFGQCQNNLATKAYDTLISGIGYGSYALSFPKWNPDSGLLVSVTVRAQVSVKYGFALKNVSAKAATYTITVGREDYFSSPVLASDFDNITEQVLGSFPLNPGDTIGRDPYPVLTNIVNTDSITGNSATFAGSGLVSFSYSPITYTNIHTNNNSSYSYSATATDTVHFSVSYLYCRNQAPLPVGILRFNALARDASTVKLIWSTADEAAGRVYYIQRSSDSQSFETIDSVTSDPGGGAVKDYTSYDNPPPGIRKWYYRLQLVNHTTVTYSTIQEVTLPQPAVAKAGSELPFHRIFPNPATDLINLVLAANDEQAGDWQVDIFNASGTLVQRESYQQAHTVRIDFHQKLAAGVYILRATDLRGRRSFNSSFVITGSL
jgi:hypothetical protein